MTASLKEVGWQSVGLTNRKRIRDKNAVESAIARPEQLDIYGEMVSATLCFVRNEGVNLQKL